jgi:hypothetical protein
VGLLEGSGANGRWDLLGGLRSVGDGLGKGIGTSPSFTSQLASKR